MITGISRRGCLKLLVAGGALSLAPVQILQAGQRTRALVIAASEEDCQRFTEGVAQRAHPVLLPNTASQLNALSALSDMSSGDLIVGLVNDAQKVLIESFINDRRGVVHEIARVSSDLGGRELAALGAMTINAALSDKRAAAAVGKAVIGNGSLISFYGYIS